MSMHIVRAGIGALIFASAAFGATVHTYEDLAEGAYGETLSHNGVTYHDINQVSGVFPDGSTFTPDDLQHESIVEQATLFYNDFPGYGSPVNALTFGWVYIPGDNLSIGPLASAWMDLDENATSVSFDLAYYENGPWGGIEYFVDAYLGDSVVGSDSFVIAGIDDRDNPTFDTMSIDGVEFDSLHVYAMYNGEFSAPRGMIDNLTITAVPTPASLLALLGAAAMRRRR
jgi:hypothetical protein